MRAAPGNVVGKDITMTFRRGRRASDRLLIVIRRTGTVVVRDRGVHSSADQGVQAADVHGDGMSIGHLLNQWCEFGIERNARCQLGAEFIPDIFEVPGILPVTKIVAGPRTTRDGSVIAIRVPFADQPGDPAAQQAKGKRTQTSTPRLPIDIGWNFGRRGQRLDDIEIAEREASLELVTFEAAAGIQAEGPIFSRSNPPNECILEQLVSSTAHQPDSKPREFAGHATGVTQFLECPVLFAKTYFALDLCLV